MIRLARRLIPLRAGGPDAAWAAHQGVVGDRPMVPPCGRSVDHGPAGCPAFRRRGGTASGTRRTEAVP